MNALAAVQQAQDDIDAENEAPESTSLPVTLSADLRKKINFAAETLTELAAERRATNERVKAVLDDFEAMGLSRKAAKWALKLMDLDDTERQQLDLAVRLIRGAQGIPEQLELLTYRQ